MIAAVGIVGLGLIGGSLGGALRRQGVTVTGFDAREDACRIAQERGLIDATASTIEGVAGQDLVMLAMPVSAIVDLLPVVDASTGGETIIMDAGSVKRPVIEIMQALEHASRAIGGHPLAGKERVGAVHADADLFTGRPFILTPSVETSESTINRARELAVAIGARPLLMDPEEHDRVVARTSHLPQLLSTVLALQTGGDAQGIFGPGLTSMTRLAGSDPAMWREILLMNRDHVSAAARELIDQLQEVLRMIESGDARGIEKTLQAGRIAYARNRQEANR